MNCRVGCGACCIAPSITSALPGMPRGKPAGVRCVNLDPESHLCRIWGTDAYPDVCRRFEASPETCGTTRAEAITLLADLEQETSTARERAKAILPGQGQGDERE